jgi:hypothetical protein
MDWISTIAKIIIRLFTSSDCEDKPRPYPVDKRWIEIERDRVNDALKKKHGGNNGPQ